MTLRTLSDNNLGYLYKILELAKKRQDNDKDTCFCVVGDERVGKSNLMLWMMEYLKAPFENITLDGVSFIKRLGCVPECSAIALDEAGDTLFSRDGMTRETKQFVKCYQAIGGMRFITILCLPSFFRLDKYFREDRVRGLFYVYQRGRWVFFSKKEINTILRNGYIKLPPKYKRKYYPKYDGELLELYKKLKFKKMREATHLNLDKKKKEITQADIIRELYNKGKSWSDVKSLDLFTKQHWFQTIKHIKIVNSK